MTTRLKMPDDLGRTPRQEIERYRLNQRLALVERNAQLEDRNRELSRQVRRLLARLEQLERSEADARRDFRQWLKGRDGARR